MIVRDFIRFAQPDSTPLTYDVHPSVTYAPAGNDYWYVTGPKTHVLALVNKALQADDLNSFTH